MEHASNNPSGLRKTDPATAVSLNLASQFEGTAEILPSQYLAAFKRAAPYLAIPRSVVHLVDALFAWTQKQDWLPDQQPIVWPRNELLAQKLCIGVRHLQHLLALACKMHLISHKDSPNGRRGGARSADGNIIWAYGMVLSPIAVRYEEFLSVAAKGIHQDREMDITRKRVAAARRQMRSIALSPISPEIAAVAANELELARIAVHHLRSCRDLATLTSAAEQLEQRVASLLGALMADADPTLETSKIPPLDEPDLTHSTTTKQHLSANAEYSNGYSEESSSGGYDVRKQTPQTPAEVDLERYGVTPAFLESTAPEICYSLTFENPTWGDVTTLAERLAHQNSINPHTWREACRLMGQKAAAAAVIATVQKYRAGAVNSPGAYLRGMSRRAASGDLHLGRTFHGLKDVNAAATAVSMRNGDNLRSFGQIAIAALQKARTPSCSSPRTRPIGR